MTKCLFGAVPYKDKALLATCPPPLLQREEVCNFSEHKLKIYGFHHARRRVREPPSVSSRACVSSASPPGTAHLSYHEKLHHEGDGAYKPWKPPETDFHGYFYYILAR